MTSINLTGPDITSTLWFACPHRKQSTDLFISTSKKSASIRFSLCRGSVLAFRLDHLVKFPFFLRNVAPPWTLLLQKYLMDKHDE